MSFGFSVGDFIAVGELAWNLYQNCYKVARGAPKEFQLLLGEISTVYNSLQILQEEALDPNSILVQAGEDRVRMVKEMVARIDITLKKLQKLAAKYEILGPGSKGKQIWTKFKWSVEFTSVDSLRNKLIRHNTEMNLILTCVGNSSLSRIESSTKALETDVLDIKCYILASSGNKDSQASGPPSVSVVDDETFKISLSANLMRHAEVLQPWNTIGVDQWIQAGKWWLLKSQMELYAVPESDKSIPPSAYANLIKSSWILIDIIAGHPQVPFFTSNTHFDVQLLSSELKNEFKRISELHLVVPDLRDLEDQNLLIWETQARAPVIRPGKMSRKLDITPKYGDFWVVGGEQTFFQRFASYERKGLTESLPCMILYLVHETTSVARIIAQDQNGTALMEIIIQQHVIARAEGNFVKIDAESITFATPKDARYLCSIVEAAKLYFFCRSNGPVNLEDFKAFILMVAVKNDCSDEVMQRPEHPTSSISPSDTGSLGSVLTVASTLVSQLSDGVLEKSEGDRSDITLFNWALLYGYESLGNLLLMEKIAYVETKDSDGQAALHQAVLGKHEKMVRLALENGANIDAKDNNECTALYLAAKGGQEAIVQLLLENGASTHETAEHGWTVVEICAQYGNEALMRLLIEHGADVNGYNYDGGPLHWAAKGGHEAVARLLLEKGVDVAVTYGNGGWTALDFAAEKGHEEIVRLLIEKGADVEKISNGTALDLAAGTGHERVVRLLVEQGADFVAKVSKGAALCEARKNKHEGVVQFLLEQGWDAMATKEYSPWYLFKE